jgi:hypothetical protein
MNLLKKIDIYYIVTLLFLLVSANASILSANDICWFSILAFMLIVAIGKSLMHIRDLRIIGIFSLVYVIFVVVRDLTINNLDVKFLLSDGFFLVKYIFLTFVFCTVLKEKAAIYIVRVMIHLTIISFFFFALQLVGLDDFIYKYSTALNLTSDNLIPGYTNFIFFTFTKGFHDYSNSGFVWEPGSFGCFLVIALMLNLFLNKFTFDKKSNIFIFGIFTTFSTTDYLALLIIFYLAYRVKVPKLNWWAILIVLISAAIIVLVPILGDKISDTYYEDMDDLHRLKYLEIFYRHKHMQIPLNRFSSMVYIVDTFKTQLFLGVSNKYNVILNSAYSINISNGVFDFIAKFGLVGFVYLLYRFSKFCLISVLKWEYVFYCIIALLIIGFGEPILILPIVLMFIFLPGEQLKSLQKPGLNTI